MECWFAEVRGTGSDQSRQVRVNTCGGGVKEPSGDPTWLVRRRTLTRAGHRWGDRGIEEKGTSYGRRGLRRAHHRHLRIVGVDVARAGETAMNGSGTLANVIGGVLALLLIIYLFVALIRPEKF